MVALPFTLKSILRQKEDYYENSNIFHHAKIYYLQKKSSKIRNQNLFKTLL
jgi:hypothetical protein